MDAVKSFNAELSSLYEVKPPISKAKMTAITRGAIKAIKFYKHVVQSVEKFILKCKPEYKVPGLYVIDSIVRQSRHQFGADKDVFAPRFAKNMRQTFVNLFACPAEDKSKIIRVLNLWQKNQVFAPEVIQPLFDLADPNNPIHKELGTPLQSNGMNTNTAIVKGSPALQKTPTKGSQQGIEGAHLGGTNLNITDPNVIAHLQQLQRLLTRSGDVSAKTEGPVHFDRKLLDFDYGDEEDEAHSTPKAPAASDSVATLLTNPEVLRQLQTLQQTMTAGQTNEVDIEKLRKLQEMKQQEEEFDKHLAQTVPNLPFAAECEFKPGNNTSVMNSGYFMPPGADLSHPPPGYKPQQPYEMPHQQNLDSDIQFVGGENDNGGDVEIITLDHGDSRSPSQHEDRYNRRRRSRSRERSRDRRDRERRVRRSRSRSKTRRHRTRSRDRNNRVKEKESEKDKERKKRGLPAIKKENLSVCSTTLWVGHLSKLVHQEDLSNTFGEFGDIVSIDLIPPRGCAFIVMHRRQDAARCLTKLKNHMLHGKAITLAWAPGKGVKGKDLKDYWEGDLGVSYIPWSKLKPDIDIEMLEDGGMVDEDTMPTWMKAKVSTTSNKPPGPNENMAAFMQLSDAPITTSTVDTSQPPPVPGTNLLQPPPMTLPLVSPFQFNNRLIGMNIAPGMLSNVPIGVPPPNIPGALMQNQLVGLGSPFQGATSLMAPLPMQSSDKSQHAPNELNIKLTDTLINMTQSYGIIPQPPMSHDDNMDIEMEDAEKSERPPLLSEQLAASIGHYNINQGGHRPNPGGLGSDIDIDNRRDNKRMDRDRRHSRSRERDRDRNRDRGRERSRGMNRDEDYSNRDDNRGRIRKDDRRERPNRWGDREPEVVDRREREKTLNDRLQQMANEGVYPPTHDRVPPPRDRNDSESSMPPNLMDRRMFPPPHKAPMINPLIEDPYVSGPPDNFNNPIISGPPNDFNNPMGGPPDEFNLPMGGPDDFNLPMGGPPDDFNLPIGGPPDDFNLPMGGPPDEFNHPIGGPPDDFNHPMGGPPDDFNHPMGGPPDDFIHPMGGPPEDFNHPMGGPPEDFNHPMDGPTDDFNHPMGGPDEFNHPMDGPPDDFNLAIDGPPMDDYNPMMDHPPNFPPRLDGPMHPRMHMDDFEGERFMRGGRRNFRDKFDPRMRGPPGPDFFQPRDDFGPGPGPRMMRGGPDFPPQRPPLMRGSGPHKFHPRGPPGMRGPRPNAPWKERQNFGPRFDHPDFHRGPPGPPGPPGRFDEPPHMRHRGGRFEDRRRPRQDFPHEGGPPENPRFERRSRWGNNSPRREDFREPHQDIDPVPADAQVEPEINKGGNTPLHDEPLNRENGEGNAHMQQADVSTSSGTTVPQENKTVDVPTEGGQEVAE